MYMCRHKTQSACIHKCMCTRWRRGENAAKQEHRCGENIEGSVMDVYVWMCMSLLCCYLHSEGSVMDVYVSFAQKGPVCIYICIYIYIYIYMCVNIEGSVMDVYVSFAQEGPVYIYIYVYMYIFIYIYM